MSDLKKFDYEGHPVTFEFVEGNKMVNATQMAKTFGKRVDNFMRLKGTKDYILLLKSRYSDVREREVVRIVQGGTPELQGTWIDEKLALKFAAWLSPEFELWVYDRIFELLTEGMTQLPQNKKELQFYLQKIMDNTNENRILLKSLPIKGLDLDKLT